MSWSIVTVTIQREQDVVTARQRARQLAVSLGFDLQDQTRLATAVSEIARNAFNYAGGGKVEYSIEGQTQPQIFLIKISDKGPGIRALEEILDGQYHSTTGMGLGILGARRLMDRFHIESIPGQGTTIWLRKLFARGAPLVTPKLLQQITDELMRQGVDDPLHEVQRQNQELLQALTELRQRQDDLLRLNRELEDTNRGVVALYAELDERANHLRRADELKSRFISNMSHEFRTPLNSQLALTRLLLSQADGELNSEQVTQVQFIRKGAENLLELVNDLLDLAKIEAGKIEIYPVEFSVVNLFSALRGMLRPLLVGEAVSLVFEEPTNLPFLYSDEGKASQILRNFLSNALKFTEQGEVRVSARLTPMGDAVTFAVADTGIGIATEDQGLIFEEFTQIKNQLQHQVKGTGLGLPLCRRLAELLGGSVAVESQPGVGSTFTATIPLIYQPVVSETADLAPALQQTGAVDASHPFVLVVEDSDELIFLYQKYLAGTGFQIWWVHSLWEAHQVLQQQRPAAIILDILLRGEDAWAFLAELKANTPTSQIPVLVITTAEDQQKGIVLGADAYAIKPVSQAWLVDQIRHLAAPRPVEKILLIEDQDAERYLLRRALDPARYQIIEAADGLAGLRQARQEQPDLIVLDLVMPVLDGWQVLQQLRADARLQPIPVIMLSGQSLTISEHQRLVAQNVLFLAKSEYTPERLHAAIAQLMGGEKEAG